MRKLSDIEKKIVDWQSRFPCDRWWREKHNVAFMSREHKEISFLDQLFEFTEDNLVEEFRSAINDQYTPNTGDFLISQASNKESQIADMQKEFENEFPDLLDG